MTRIRAVLFDLWGTLATDLPGQSERRQGVRVRLMREALAAAGHLIGDEEITSALRAFAEYHVGLQAREKDISSPERVVVFLDRVGRSLARRLSPEAVRALEEAFAGAARHVLPSPVDGARDVLAESRARGLAVGLVSNTGYTAGHVLREIIGGWGLRRYFDVLTFSDEARQAKPAQGIFRCTLDALGVRPEEAAFLGDGPRLDVVGALRVGMWSVQIGDQHLDDADPHARITRLTDLFPALESLGVVPRRAPRRRRPDAGR